MTLSPRSLRRISRTLRRLTAAAAFFSAASRSPAASTGSANVPAAASPIVTSSSPNRIRHARETQACEQRVEAMAGQRCDLIFIGDSITQAWESVGKPVWQLHFASRHALNFGVSGDRTQDVLWRLEHQSVQGLHPKAAVVLIGTNNVSDSPADIAAGIKSVVDRTRDCFPGVKIILVSILPNARATAKMAAVNPLLRSYADGSQVVFLDLASQFTPVGDSWKGLGPDRLHLTREGYQLWAAALEPLL